MHYSTVQIRYAVCNGYVLEYYDPSFVINRGNYLLWIIYGFILYLRGYPNERLQ